MWICTEVLTDTFKFLSRKDLLEQMQPSNSRLNAICNQKVDNLHVITNFQRLLNELDQNLNVAAPVIRKLIGNEGEIDECFRLKGEVELRIARNAEESDEDYERRGQLQKRVIQHCLKLFNGSNLYVYLSEEQSENDAFYEYLEVLKPIQPPYVHIGGCVPREMLKWKGLLRKSLILTCNKLDLSQTSETEPKPDEIVYWVHYQSAKIELSPHQQTRFLNVPSGVMLDLEYNYWQEFLNECIKEFCRASLPEDRRSYMVIFTTSIEQWPFSIDNERTGETLIFHDAIIHYMDMFFQTYRLRRCLTGETDEQNSQRFYDEVFDEFGGFILEDRQKYPVTLVLC